MAGDRSEQKIPKNQSEVNKGELDSIKEMFVTLRNNNYKNPKFDVIGKLLGELRSTNSATREKALNDIYKEERIIKGIFKRGIQHDKGSKSGLVMLLKLYEKADKQTHKDDILSVLNIPVSDSIARADSIMGLIARNPNYTNFAIGLLSNLVAPREYARPPDSLLSKTVTGALMLQDGFPSLLDAIKKIYPKAAKYILESFHNV